MAIPKLPFGGYKGSHTEEKKSDYGKTQSKKEKVWKLNKEMEELSKHKAEYKYNEEEKCLTFFPTPKDKCKPSEEKLETNKIKMDYILKKQGCGKSWAYSNPDEELIESDSNTCSFIAAALTAWSQHFPFRFRCEHIWLLILQGVAVHVDKNAEKLRSKYVKHDGKMRLQVDVPANPSIKEWQAAIEQFESQIDKNTVEDTCKLFNCDFTTSTLIEKVATKVTIMDICKNYFSYYCMTRCGFPQITLDGKQEDWIKLKQKTEKLLNEKDGKVDKKFGNEWGKALLPLLDRFIDAYDGKIDCVFWNSMIKRGATGGSGGYSWYSGWFNILFPFLTDDINEMCVPYSIKSKYVEQGFESMGRGWGENKQTDYPIGLSSAPVTWNRLGKQIKLKFLAGFIGYHQNTKTGELCPNIGWCIAQEADKKKKDDDDEDK